MDIPAASCPSVLTASIPRSSLDGASLFDGAKVAFCDEPQVSNSETLSDQTQSKTRRPQLRSELSNTLCHRNTSPPRLWRIAS